MTCIYCAGRSGDDQMTLEHIWPQSLGGAFAPPIFQTRDVCRRCNSTCGLFVDGAFLKSWFISAERGSSAHDFLDPQRPGPAPFWYMGIDAEFPVAKNDVCERWLGLAGEHIYHVHQRDSDRWTPFAGGDIIRRKTDPGRVYIFLTSPTAYWSLTALASLIQHFPTASRRCMTHVDGLPLVPIAMPFDLPKSAKEAREIDWINKRPMGIPHPQKAVFQLDFSDRFLAKLSLGLGHTILGAKVSASPYADELRKMLWSKSAAERENLAVRGSGYWQDIQTDVPDLLKWPGAWSLYLTIVSRCFAMALTTPGGRFLSMQISDCPDLWNLDIDRGIVGGSVFLFIPQRSRVIGPVPVMEYIAHRLGNGRREDLAELESLRRTLDNLPPKMTSTN